MTRPATYCAHPQCNGLAYRVGCVYLCRSHRQLAIGSHAAPRAGEHWRRQRTATACTLCGATIGGGLTDDELTEEQWWDQVKDLLKLYGWRYYHTRDSRRSEPGFPDVICLKGARQLALELKREGGRLTEAQKAWLNDFAAAGAEAGVFMPHQREALARTLAR